jgi:DNA-binding transcriptional MerR regulator
MGWSTSEVARLAGVSVRAVRYYHEVGLLPMPERRANGYKSYGVLHLIRLLRIRRLTSLGFTLAQISELDSPGPETATLFEALDTELAEKIDQLQQIRQELNSVLNDEVRDGLPPGFSRPATGAELTDADKATLTVLHQLLPAQRHEQLKAWLNTSVDSAADDDFERLPDDADDAARADLAVRMLPAARKARQARRSSDPTPPQTARDIGKALRDIYNPAQLDVLTRVATLLDAESL